MEPTQTGFNLNEAIRNWQNTLLNGALTPDDITELTQHLQDEVTELQSKGLNEEESWLVARNRMGNKQVIEEEFSKVNPDFVASRNWLMLFWGACIFMILQTLVFIVPTIFRFIVIGDSPVLSSRGLSITISGICIGLLILLVVNLARVNKISAWFNHILTKHSTIISILIIIAGSFVAFYNFGTLIGPITKQTDNQGFLNDDDIMLGFIFYGSLLFSTAYFTVRYRKQELRSFKLFANSLDWKVCIIAGLIFQLACQMTYMVHLHSLSFITVFVFFGLTGWAIGCSKNYLLNLLGAQLAPLVIFLCGLYINIGSGLFFFTIYLAAVAALCFSCFINRRNEYQVEVG